MGAIRPDTVVLNWLLTLPFFAALCAAIFPRLNLGAHAEGEAEALRRGPFLLGALASLMGVLLSAALIQLTVGGSPVAVDYWWTKDLYHLRFQADALTSPIVLLIFAIGLLLNLYLAGSPLLPDPHRRAALLLLAQGCAVACCLSADLVLMCFTMLLALLAFWLLIYLDSHEAANTLVSATYLGATVFLGAALIIWSRAGDSSTAPLAMLLIPAEAHQLQLVSLLVLIGLLPMMAAFPSNSWVLTVADGSPILAPAPALLLPVLGMCLALRLLPGSVMLASLPALGSVAIVLGMASLWWGALRALLAVTLRNLVCWLTVSQVGVLLICLGAAASPTAAPESVRAAVLQAVAAPVALLLLWIAVGAIRCRFGTDFIADLAGVGSRAPAAAACLLLGGLSLAAVPPFPGFQVQRLLIGSLLHGQQLWLGVIVLAADLVLAAAALDALRRMLAGSTSAVPRWSSPWLSLSLVLSIVALLSMSAASSRLGAWSELTSRAVLSISRSSLAVPP